MSAHTVCLFFCSSYVLFIACNHRLFFRINCLTFMFNMMHRNILRRFFEPSYSASCLLWKKNIYIDCNCNTHLTDFVHKFHIIWQKIFAFTSLWEIYISCTWFAKSALQKNAQVEYSLNMGLFETAISQYWQRLTLWFLHLQWLQSPNGAESEIFRKKLSAFHFKVVFKWKTFQSFFVRECLWNMAIDYGVLHFLTFYHHLKHPTWKRSCC